MLLGRRSFPLGMVTFGGKLLNLGGVREAKTSLQIADTHDVFSILHILHVIRQKSPELRQKTISTCVCSRGLYTCVALCQRYTIINQYPQSQHISCDHAHTSTQLRKLQVGFYFHLATCSCIRCLSWSKTWILWIILQPQLGLGMG